jgi:GTPase SAR1 family protein
MGYSRYARLHHIWSFQTRTPDSHFVGQEEFDRLRSLSYAETHVIMICFSVDNPISLENVESKVDHLPPFQPFLIIDPRGSG